MKKSAVRVQSDFFDGDETVVPERLLVNKSNNLIAGQSKLTLNEQKLLAAAIALINPTEPVRDEEGYLFAEMSHKQIAVMLNTEVRFVRRYIEKAARAYHTIPILLPRGSKKGEDQIINIAHASTPCTVDGHFRIQFHKKIEPELIDMARYAKYELSHVVDVRSNYSFRLYELLVKAYNFKRGGSQFCSIALQDIYFPLGITEADGTPITKSYIDRYNLFAGRVLNPAVSEISEKTDLDVVYSPYRVGLKVAGVRFRVRYKAPLDEEASELSQSTESLLLRYGIDNSLYLKLAERYGMAVVENNLAYMQRAVDSGTQIENPKAFFAYLLKYNVADLPPIANPYSDCYHGDLNTQVFVREYLVPFWWQFPESFRDDLLSCVNLSASDVVAQDYLSFMSVAKQDGIDAAKLLLDPAFVVDAWTFGGQ